MTEPQPTAFSNHDEPVGTPEPGRGSKALAFWGLLAVVSLGLLVLVATRPPSTTRSGADDPLVGSTISFIGLEPLTGDAPAITSENLTGKVTLVNFWGTWCPPCLVEFPQLDELRKELAKHDDFRFASVSCWQGIETDIDQLRSETETFLKQQHSDLPTYHDPEAKTRIALSDALQGRNLVFPMTVLFDRQGVVRGLWLGYRPGMEDDVQRVTEEVLAAK